MIGKLIKALGAFPKAIMKEDVEVILAEVMKATREQVIPTWEMVEGLDNKLFDKKVISNMIRPLGAKNIDDAIKKIIKVNNSISQMESQITALVDSLPESIVTKHSTYRESAIVNLINDISTFATYQPDFIMASLKAGSDGYNKAKTKTIKDGVVSFVSMITYFSNLSDNIKQINKIDNEIIINEENKKTASLLAKTDINFVTVPVNALIDTIYSIRVFLVDVEIKKYENLINKKNLIELRVLELKKSQDGGADTSTKKAIATYVREIENIEYKLKKIENL